MSLIIGGFVTGWIAQRHVPATAAAPPPAQHMTVIDDLDLGAGDRLRLIEVPDRLLPYRCVLLTTAGRSQLFCPEAPALTGGLPPQ